MRAWWPDDWLAAITASVRPSTWESYERNLRVHVKPRLGSTPLQGLTASMLNAFYAELLLSGRSNQENGLSPRTVRYIHTILRKALKDAVRWNHLARNVADSADPPKPRTSQARLVQTWTAPQLRCFLDHVKGDRLYPAYLLAATTGMRRGEIGGLRWQDIDFDTSRVAVRQTLIVVGYQLHWSTPKTDRGRRNIAIDPATMDALRSHKA
ncbi:MAG: tyrosine-type recombinase/integrase, partial [Gaiellales bacterium]